MERLRQGQPNFSVTDAELFDIDTIEEQAREALAKNRRLNEELKRIKREQIRVKSELSS